jgi:predicted Zn-dependent protease with MMP-like domain
MPAQPAPAASLHPPSGDDLAAVGQAVLDGLPAAIRDLVRHVPIVVQDWPDEETLDAVGIEDPLDLTGLYRAVPHGQRFAVAAPSPEPEMIFLFRLPILLEWCERHCSLEEVVFDVLTHEIGHHFGMTEDEVLRMEGRGLDEG